MKAFVTGGTGFVGSHLVRKLQETGSEVKCLVRSPAKAAAVFGAHPPETIAGNLDNTGALEEGCSGATVVFHVAGLVAARSEREFHQTNVEATARVLHAAARTADPAVRFVYVSSLAAAGPVSRGEVLSDADAANPVTKYGRSKLEGEKLVRRSDFDWTVIRPPAVYGPRDTEMLKVFQMVKWGIAPIFGDGLQQLSLIHGEDLAAAIVASANPGCAGKSYYAAHPEIVTSGQLVTAAYRAVKQSEDQSPVVLRIPGPLTRAILHLTNAAARATRSATILTPDKAAEFLAPAWTCDSSPLTNDTGWKARFDLAAGTRQTADWYREHSWL